MLVRYQVEPRQKVGKKETTRKMESDEWRRRSNLVDSSTSGFLAGEVKEMGNVERGSSSVLAEEPFQHVCRSWGRVRIK